jgi:hypothetical protein
MMSIAESPWLEEKGGNEQRAGAQIERNGSYYSGLGRRKSIIGLR